MEYYKIILLTTLIKLFFVSQEHKILYGRELFIPQDGKKKLIKEVSLLKKEKVSGLSIAWNIW